MLRKRAKRRVKWLSHEWEIRSLLAFLDKPGRYCNRRQVRFAKESRMRREWWRVFTTLYRHVQRTERVVIGKRHPHVLDFPRDLNARETEALRDIHDLLDYSARWAWGFCGLCGRLTPFVGNWHTCRYCRARNEDKLGRSRKMRREGMFRALLPDEVWSDIPGEQPPFHA